jgi:branched-chain amino acid transport system ATP-binding protein
MSSTAIHVSGLTHDFGGLRAVDNISFTINEGELVGLIGPNGCGKSTTFNCISGLLDPTSGEIEIMGKSTNDLSPDQINNLGITRTFQHTRLWKEMTVIENILVPPNNQLSSNPISSLLRPNSRKEEAERIERAYQVLESLEIAHVADNLAGKLSGGQSKLVDIARALMGSPKILLLDEPVAGVASVLAEKIFQNLRTLVNETGISILVIEHNMDFILRLGVDRIIVMDSGKILMEGASDEVRSNKSVIDAYLGSSME